MKKDIHPLFIVTLTTLAFIAFAVETDAYVPSFPDIIKALAISESDVQRILSINFLGICLSSLICGPLADSFGRRRVLVFGTGLFAFSSLLCYFAPDFSTLLFFRFIQGLGAGSIVAVTGAVVFDLFDTAGSAGLMSVLNSACTLTMAIAPVIGTWLNIRYGWHGPFLFIFVLAMLSWLGFLFFLPETLTPAKRKTFSPTQVWKAYVELFQNKAFVVGTIIWTLMVSAIITYTASISVILIDHLHVPEEWFAFYQGGVMGIFAIASLISPLLIKRWGLARVKYIGNVIFFVGCAAFIAVSTLVAPSAILLSSTMAFAGIGIALSATIYFADSLAATAGSGAAMAVSQGTRLLSSSIMTDFSRMLFDGTAASLALTIALTVAFILFAMSFHGQEQRVEGEGSLAPQTHALL